MLSNDLTKDLCENGLPHFDDIANFFVQQGILYSPAELHGNLCGHLASGQRYQDADWAKAAEQLLELPAEDNVEVVAALRALYQLSEAQFSSGDFDFALLLPDDEAPMSQRVTSLGQWCHGFLSSYAMAGGAMAGSTNTEASQLSAEAKESLQDLVQISQIASDEEYEQGSEADFAEVYEYVRMSALLVFAECNSQIMEQSAPTDQPLH